MLTLQDLNKRLDVNYKEISKNTSKQRMKHFNKNFSVVIGYTTQEARNYRKKFLSSK